MRGEQFEALTHSRTLIAVGLGAVVATLSTFAATIFERSILRRERERDAAVMFSEMLHALKRYLDLSHETHGRGEPFGSITIRMLRAVRREVDIYDRNRETLFLLRDGPLRQETHVLMARLTFSLERVLEVTEALADGASEAAHAELSASREQAYGFLIENAASIPAVVAKLCTLGRIKIARLDALPGIRAATGQAPSAAE